MKNTELFPPSRNRYFPGKQLVTRDMEAEQRYFNNKRRLLNTLLHSSGIVCGLNVTAVDHKADRSSDMSVAVEPGMAIDGMGREIIVPQQVYLRLSDLEGFSEDSGLADCVYLCIEYAEVECEPMHSVLDSAVAGDNHNRVEEAYCFCLSYSEPPHHAPDRSNEDEGDIWQRYCGRNLEVRLNELRSEKLCLAKIHLVRWDTAYSITNIEPAPFAQYVKSAAMVGELCEAMLRSYGEIPSDSDKAPQQSMEAAPAEVLVQQGEVSIRIPDNTRPENILYSENIPHGLGIGPVAMSIGIVSEKGTIYGAQGIFSAANWCDYAIKTNESTGTFCIGVKVINVHAGDELIFSWQAVRHRAAGETGIEPHLTISPATMRLKIRGTAQFEAKAYGLSSRAVAWSIREANGGSIEADGFYRAPNAPGVYEVIARSVEIPEISASAFIVVVE